MFQRLRKAASGFRKPSKPRSRVRLWLEPLGERICPSGLPPVAVADTYATHQGTTLNVTAPGTLANDTDNEQDPLTAEIYSYPSHGYFYSNSDGSFDYSPGESFVGSDSFQYRVFDGESYSNVATVTINVTNQVPVANPDSYTLQQDGSLFINAPGVLANDTDGDNDGLTAEIYTLPNSGYLFLNSDGSFEYYPGEGFTGTDSFQYWVFDSAEYSTPVTVTLVVEASTRTVTWDGGGDGIYWHDPMNWNIDQVPGAFDDVTIYTTPVPVIHISGDTTVHSLHSDADLDWSGSLTLSGASTITGTFDLDGTLTLQDGVTLDLSGGGSASGTIQLAANSEFLLSGGIFDALNGFLAQGQGQIIVGGNNRFNLNGNMDVEAMTLSLGGSIQGTGTLTINRRLNWTGGTMAGTNPLNPATTLIQNNATLEISGADHKNLNQFNLNILVGATALMTGGTLNVNGGNINNQGSFTLQGNNLSLGMQGNGQFVNQGLFRKALGQVGDVSQVGFNFINQGKVFVDSGVLLFPAFSWFTQNGASAQLIIDPLAEVRVLNGMDILNGSVEVGGFLWVGNGQVNGVLTVQGMNQSFTGQGSVEIESGSRMQVQNGLILNECSINNFGTFQWTAGDITLTNAANIENNPSGQFLIEGTGSMISMDNNCVFTNSGEIIKEGFAGTRFTVTVNNLPVPFSPIPTVTVNMGGLNFEHNGTHSATFNIAWLASVNFIGNSKNNVLQPGTIFGGEGKVVVANNSTITIDQGAQVLVSSKMQIGTPLLG